MIWAELQIVKSWVGGEANSIALAQPTQVLFRKWQFYQELLGGDEVTKNAKFDYVDTPKLAPRCTRVPDHSCLCKSEAKVWKTILAWSGSQCSLHTTGLMWSRFLLKVMTSLHVLNVLKLIEFFIGKLKKSTVAVVQPGWDKRMNQFSTLAWSR